MRKSDKIGVVVGLIVFAGSFLISGPASVLMVVVAGFILGSSLAGMLFG